MAATLTHPPEAAASLRATGPLALLRMSRALLCLVLFSLLGSLWLVLPKRLGRGFPRGAFSILCWGFAMRVELKGDVPQSPSLLLANHVSWTDIAALGAIAHIGFVAKSEVRDWPFIGKLADRYGCLFIARTRRSSVGTDTDQLANLVRQRSIILFPEGTTGDGNALLPFRSSLVGAAAAEGQPCTALALAYYWADGRPLGASGWQAVAWVGDEGLLPHVIRLALLPPLKVELAFGDTLVGACRKDLTHRAALQVSALLRQSYGH